MELTSGSKKSAQPNVSVLIRLSTWSNRASGCAAHPLMSKHFKHQRVWHDLCRESIYDLDFSSCRCL